MSAHRRFALLVPNFHPRTCGVGDNSMRLGQELQRRGHEVMVFAPGPIERHPEAPNLPVCGVPGDIPSVIAYRLAGAVQTFRPTDVILQYTSQMWNTWRFGSAATVLLLRRLRKTGARVITVAHELFVPWRRRPDLSAAALLQRLQLAAVVRSCEQLLVTTDTRAEIAGWWCRIAGARMPGVMRIGSNALPVGRAAAAQGRTPRIGFFSTAAIGKRYDVVLDAFARIGAEFPGAELVLMGDLGPPEQASVRAVHDAVAAHPFRSRIRLTGRLSLAMVAEETAALDLYLFPMESGANTRSSTLPVALGSGIPTVAVRSFETDDALFRDGDNVAFAAEMTGPAFAEASLRLLRDPALARRVSEGALRLYHEHLSWDRIADRLLAAA